MGLDAATALISTMSTPLTLGIANFVGQPCMAPAVAIAQHIVIAMAEATNADGAGARCLALAVVTAQQSGMKSSAGGAN
jgi:hypothetical protein